MKIFRDPIHNVIDLDTGDKAVNDLIIRLIDSKEFQRLRFIRQLGFVYFAYPSATHTRFEHSLGVAFLAKRFLEKIISLEEKVLLARVGFERELLVDFFNQIKADKAVTIIAALLHDIGHGPLSHVFEGIIGIKHEKWVKEIILGDTEINASLVSFNTEYPSKICKLLFNSDKPSPSSQIIAGQLDIDKIDYLLRDSHMTGSGYGKFDVEWLFNVLTVGIVDNKVEIGLVEGKGLSVAEDFVMARIYMFRNVYLHKTSLVAQGMLTLLLKRIKDLKDADFIFPNESLRRILMLNHNSVSLPEILVDYLAISDIDLFYFLNSLRNSGDEVLSRLSKGLSGRHLFKRIDERHWLEIESLITNKIGFETAQYYMLKVNTKKEKMTYQPEDDVIFLFSKSGEGFGLHEKSNVIPTRMKGEALPVECYVDQDVYNKWLEQVSH